MKPEDIAALRQEPITEDLVAAAIARVIEDARTKGQSLANLKAEVLEADTLLDAVQRRRLGEIIEQAWAQWP